MWEYPCAVCTCLLALLRELDLKQALAVSYARVCWQGEDRAGVGDIKSQTRWEPLEKEMATHSSIFSLEVPCTEESGGLQSMGVTKELDMTKQLNTVATGGSHGFVLCKMASVALLGEE